MALDQGHRIRTPSDHCRQKRTRSGIRDPSRSQNTAFKGCGPGENIQQLSDLTIRYYRLELVLPPARVASAKLASKCTTQNEKPSKGSEVVKAVGDSYSVSASSYETR